jgi:hypothetical protein
MSPDRTISQPSDTGTGQPTRDLRSSEILLVEIAKLQSDGDHLKRDVGSVQTDMRDIRDRMARLEVRVDHLPTKGFIVTALVIALTIITGIATVWPLIPRWVGTAPMATSPAPSTEKPLPQSN